MGRKEVVLKKGLYKTCEGKEGRGRRNGKALSSRASTPIVARTGLAPPKKVGHSIFGLEMYLFPLSPSLPLSVQFPKNGFFPL